MPVALVTTALQLLVQYEPEIAAAAQTAYSLINSGTPPTPEQQAAIDAALDAAHAKLQSV